MPLDRPATVRLFAEATRDDQGRTVPGAQTDCRVWLTRINAPADRELGDEGTRQVGVARFRCRWFEALASYDVALNGQVIVDGATWVIQTVDETDARDVRTDAQWALRSRRRWLKVTATRVEA